MNKYIPFYHFLLCTLLMIAANLQAEQLHFSRQEKEGGYQFNYQWLDFSQTPQSISFMLTKEALFDRFRNFRVYKPELAAKAVYQAIKKRIKQQPIDGVQVHFLQRKNQQRIEIKGIDPKKIRKAHQVIRTLEQDSITKYLADNYYHRFTSHEQEQGVKPDHASIANASVKDLKVIKPLILEKVSIQNIRKVTNYVLSFVQNIPYSPLESRLSSSGAGFNTPLKLLWENKGDCDSKVTLTAALLRTIMPRVKMVLVYIDQHALIGIAIPPEADEITITENKITYVLAEPTGPALLSLGVLAPSSEQAIYNGHYITELYHQIVLTNQ